VGSPKSSRRVSINSCAQADDAVTAEKKTAHQQACRILLDADGALAKAAALRRRRARPPIAKAIAANATADGSGIAPATSETDPSPTDK
jgi:hypothetical protein